MRKTTLPLSASFSRGAPLVRSTDYFRGFGRFGYRTAVTICRFIRTPCDMRWVSSQSSLRKALTEAERGIGDRMRSLPSPSRDEGDHFFQASVDVDLDERCGLTGCAGRTCDAQTLQLDEADHAGLRGLQPSKKVVQCGGA